MDDEDDLFGLSFVDCIASSLGAVIFLVLALSAQGQGRSELASVSRISLVLKTGATGGATKLKPFFTPPRGRNRIPVVESQQSRTAGREPYRTLDVFENRPGVIMAWVTEPALGEWEVEIWAETPPGALPTDGHVEEAVLEIGIGNRPLQTYELAEPTKTSREPMVWRLRGDSQVSSKVPIDVIAE
jgi:hypothetical protein